MFDASRIRPASRTRTLASLTAIAAALFVVSSIVGATVAAGAAGAGSVATAAQDDGTEREDAYEVPVPEPGDEYFEAADEDGEWVSYLNPRDQYRDPYLGSGSGKLCVTLLNADGEVAAGETVPNTSVSIPTGDAIEWHTEADPMTVEFPLTDHYDRPLDSDQFGTDPAYAQGDGALDAHCIEFHGPAPDETIEYGEAELDGEHAEDIEVVGYVQQANEAWETDVDPIEDARSYDEAGGGWTYEPNGSHGQAVVVLQLDGEGDGAGNDSDSNANSSGNGDENGSESNSGGDGESSGAEGSSALDPMPGPGVGATAVAMAAALAIGTALARRRRS